MQLFRRVLRNLLAVFFAGFLLAMVSGVAGEFFIELARDKGWYNNPSERLDAAMTAFSAFVTQTWFVVATAFLGGLTLGLWVDWIVRRFERLQALPLKVEQKITRAYSSTNHKEVGERAKAGTPSKTANLSPETKRLLSQIASLYKELQEVHSDESIDWEAILLPSDEPSSLRTARIMLGELQAMEMDWFYDKPLSNTLRDLISIFEKAIVLTSKPDKAQEFQGLMSRADEKAMALAQQLGAPVRYHPS